MSFLHLFTESDNQTLCPVRIVLMGAVALYHAGVTFAVMFQGLHLDFSMLGQYVQHMCELGGSIAAGVGVKSVLKGDAQ